MAEKVNLVLFMLIFNCCYWLAKLTRTEGDYNMGYDIHVEKGFVNRGNLYRMKELMKRAEQGDRITLAFLGGSITQGSLWMDGGEGGRQNYL